jgi:UDP-glucose 4-epimerase
MKVLVTGSAGHLGEALTRSLTASGHAVTGIDVVASKTTHVVGSITDRVRVSESMRGVDVVLHTATLHKPHVATHAHREFIETNMTGTLTLLEAAAEAGVKAFVFTSTTSAFGDALTPRPGAPAAWITESVAPVPKNIYGVTKLAAEDLCQLFYRNHGLPVVVLRTSRFFPEPDDNAERRNAVDDLNLKVIELLHRRVDIHDVVTAHLAAMQRAQDIGFGKFIISATTPFSEDDAHLLRGKASQALQRKCAGFDVVFRQRGWTMLEDIDRVYVNARARRVLEWVPEYDFARAVDDIAHQRDPRSPLAREVGIKGYHGEQFADGRYPVGA